MAPRWRLRQRLSRTSRSTTHAHVCARCSAAWGPSRWSDRRCRQRWSHRQFFAGWRLPARAARGLRDRCGASWRRTTHRHVPARTLWIGWSSGPQRDVIGLSVLDLGCGNGAKVAELVDDGAAAGVGVDINGNFIEPRPSGLALIHPVRPWSAAGSAEPSVRPRPVPSIIRDTPKIRCTHSGPPGRCSPMKVSSC